MADVKRIFNQINYGTIFVTSWYLCYIKSIRCNYNTMLTIRWKEKQNLIYFGRSYFVYNILYTVQRNIYIYHNDCFWIVFSLSFSVRWWYTTLKTRDIVHFLWAYACDNLISHKLTTRALALENILYVTKYTTHTHAHTIEYGDNNRRNIVTKTPQSYKAHIDAIKK